MEQLLLDLDKLERMRQLLIVLSGASFTNPVCDFIKEHKPPDETFSDNQCKMYTYVKDAIILPPKGRW